MIGSNRISDYDYFINAKAKRRTPSALREIMKTIRENPQSISFAVGVPNVDTFPFRKLLVDMKDDSDMAIAGPDIEAALQYMPTSGHIPLVAQLQALQDATHGHQDWAVQKVMVTCGAQEPMSAVFDMVVSEGDPVILPIPVYTGASDLLKPLLPQYIALEQDKDGIQPQQLRQRLEEIVRSKGVLPKLMYVNPTGCNPTGRNLPLERKKEFYRIASEYNFLILEDDPYYHLQFSKEMIPSFLSMDVEGRVIRLDTFSKTLGSGLRVGYVTGPQQLIRRVECHLHVTSLHTSALSQVLISKLLQRWSHTEYVAHLDQVRRFYQEKRDLLVAACNRYLKELAEWEVPVGGMFLWLKVTVLEDTWDLAARLCPPRNILVVPGHVFFGALAPPQHNYLRLSFSLVSPDQIDQGIRVLSEIIQEEAARQK